MQRSDNRLEGRGTRERMLGCGELDECAEENAVSSVRIRFVGVREEAVLDVDIVVD